MLQPRRIPSFKHLALHLPLPRSFYGSVQVAVSLTAGRRGLGGLIRTDSRPHPALNGRAALGANKPPCPRVTNDSGARYPFPAIAKGNPAETTNLWLQATPAPPRQDGSPTPGGGPPVSTVPSDRPSGSHLEIAAELQGSGLFFQLPVRGASFAVSPVNSAVPEQRGFLGVILGNQPLTPATGTTGEGVPLVTSSGTGCCTRVARAHRCRTVSEAS